MGKYLLVLGDSQFLDSQLPLQRFLNDRGLNLKSYRSYGESLMLFSEPMTKICGVVLFPIFSVKIEESFATSRGQIYDSDRKKIRSICRKSKIPLIEIDSFDGSDAVKKRIKTWLRTCVFKG